MIGIRMNNVRAKVAKHSLMIGHARDRIIPAAAVNLMQPLSRLLEQIREVVTEGSIEIVFKD